MKINFSKKLIVILASATAVLAAGILLCYFLLRKPVVAIYGLNKMQKSALTELKVFYKNEKPLVKFVELDSEQPLAPQLKKSRAGLLFAFQSAELQKCAAPLLESSSEKLGIEQKTLAPYTDTVSSIAGISKAGRVVKIPLANDFLSIAYDSNFLNEFGINDFNSLGDVERYLRRCKNYVNSPFVFSGAEKNFMLNLAGVFCEAVSGAENYSSAMKICDEYYKSGKRDANELVKTLCNDEENSPFYDAIKTLKDWYTKGYFSRDTFSMKYGDVREFMKSNAAPLVVLFLSARRASQRDTIKRYISSYFPSEHYGSRMFCAPTLCALCLSKNKTLTDIATRLALTEMQEIFSSQSGLAPVIASCKTADLQADDVRFWTAACSVPLSTFADDVFVDSEFAAQVSDLIARVIVN